jgi:centromere-localized protein 2
MRKPLTGATVQPEIERACASLEAELRDMEAEASAMLNDIKTTIGDLSDLRYGRFAKTTATSQELGDEVVEALRHLEAVCEGLEAG